MASACINNVGLSPDNFIDCSLSYPTPDWLSPRISFSHDFADDGVSNDDERPKLESSMQNFTDFEFRLDDPVKMLTADELFSDGKLIPLKLAPMQQAEKCPADIGSPVPINFWRRVELSGSDLNALSPKAPRCSSRWMELLGLKKAQNSKPEFQNVEPPTSSKRSSTKSLKLFLQRNPSSDSSLSFPLLRGSDSDSISISACVSLSSGTDQEDLPRFFLDSEKSKSVSISLCRNPPRASVSNARTPAIRRTPGLPEEGNKTARIPESAVNGELAVRVGRSPMRRRRDPSDLSPLRGSSMDSPRLNASGKVIFQGLERSSSSPSTFNGGPRPRLRGMERSYSVLNVPVCSLRGSAKSISAFDFGHLFSPQKKEKDGSFSAKHGVSSTTGLTKTKC